MKKLRKSQIKGNFENPLCKNCFEGRGGPKDDLLFLRFMGKIFKKYFCTKALNFFQK